MSQIPSIIIRLHYPSLSDFNRTPVKHPSPPPWASGKPQKGSSDPRKSSQHTTNHHQPTHRQWITSHLIENCGKSAEHAARTAAEWEGCGANLWQYKYEAWVRYLGPVGGWSIHGFVLRAYRKDCRPYIVVSHYEKKWEVAK